MIITQPWICGSVIVAILFFGGVLDAAARNEAAVGQCGLAFVDACQNMESTSHEKCMETATKKYNKCMDAALAAPPSRTSGPNNPPPKGRGGLTPPPPAGLLEGGTGFGPQGPAKTGGKPGTPSGGAGTIY